MDQDRIMRVARIVAAREKDNDSNYSNSNSNEQKNGNQKELFYIPCEKKEEKMGFGQKSTIYEIYMYLICNDRNKREQLTETGVMKRTKKPDPRNYEKYD